jgi:hypothetical protein
MLQMVAAVSLGLCLMGAVHAQEAPLPPQPIPVQPPGAESGPAGPSTGLSNQNAQPSTTEVLPAPRLTAPPPSPSPGYTELPPAPYVAIPVRQVIYEPAGIWFDVDYLLWWTKQAHVPALVTSTLPSDSGLLGPANPQTLYSGGDVNDDGRSGGRFSFGFWFQDTHVLGLETTYFFLGQRTALLASGLEDAAPPGNPPGTYDVAFTSLLQGAEINILGNVTSSSTCRLDLLGGFRFLQLNERLHVVQDFVSNDDNEEDTWDDLFRARNNFYGGQVGARAEWMRDRLFVDVCGKVALGFTDQDVLINGGVTQTVASIGTDGFGNTFQSVQVSHSSSGGLLAQPARYRRDYFTVVPEIDLRVGYQFTRYLRASIGYNFLFWSSVVRPGDQVPEIPKATTFWAQGLTCNLGFTF